MPAAAIAEAPPADTSPLRTFVTANWTRVSPDSPALTRPRPEVLERWRKTADILPFRTGKTEDVVSTGDVASDAVMNEGTASDAVAAEEQPTTLDRPPIASLDCIPIGRVGPGRQTDLVRAEYRQQYLSTQSPLSRIFRSHKEENLGKEIGTVDSIINLPRDHACTIIPHAQIAILNDRRPGSLEWAIGGTGFNERPLGLFCYAILGSCLIQRVREEIDGKFCEGFRITVDPAKIPNAPTLQTLTLRLKRNQWGSTEPGDLQIHYHRIRVMPLPSPASHGPV